MISFENFSIFVISTIFEFHRFLQIKFKNIAKFNNDIKQIIVVIVALYFVFVFLIFNFWSINTKQTIFVEFVDFFVEWNIDIIRFRRTYQKFRKHIVVYRTSTIFRNFIEIRHSFVNSKFNNFFNEYQLIFIDALQRVRFRNVLSLNSIFNFSSLSNLNQKNYNRNFSLIRKSSTTNTSRHVTIKSNINESKTFRKFNNIFDITIEKIIYRRSIDFELSSNMFEHINVVIQRFLNEIAKRIVVRVVKIYI